MGFRTCSSFLLSLFTLCLSVSLNAQTEDPFGLERNPGHVDLVQQKKPIESGKVKEFKEKLQGVQDSFAKMAVREAAMRESVGRMREQVDLYKAARGGKKIDVRLKELHAEFNAEKTAIELELSQLRSDRELLKKKVESLYIEKTKAEETARKAVGKRNEMHQTLFEELLYSELADRQELALNHLLACFDKYGEGQELPVDVRKPEILRRLSRLTESDNSKVKLQASRCLFASKRDSAIEMGIQFGQYWRPVEIVKADAETQMIWAALQEKCFFDFEDSPLVDLVEEVQQKYRVHFRLDTEVNESTLVTYVSHNRTLEATLLGVLDELELSYAVIDGEIQVMKKTNPKVRVSRTYNVRGLISDKTDIKTLVKVAEQAAGKAPVELMAVGTDVIVAKAGEADQLRISEKLGSLASPAKW